MASVTLLLPVPLAPTRTQVPGDISSLFCSGKLLNPSIARCLRNTRLPLITRSDQPCFYRTLIGVPTSGPPRRPARMHSAWNDHSRHRRPLAAFGMLSGAEGDRSEHSG